MGNGLAAFAAGMGSGYLSAKQREKEEKRIEEDRALRLEDIQNRRDDRQREQQNRIGLANATRKAEVNDNGATMTLADGKQTVYDMPEGSDVAGSDFRQLRQADEATGQQTLARATLADARMPAGSQTEASQPTMGLADMQVARPPQQAATVNGRAYDNTAQAQGAADAYNKPEARTLRLADAYDAQGAPDKAIAVRQHQEQATRQQEVEKRAQAEYARKLNEEGVFQAVRALRAGDGAGMVKVFNGGGQYKIDGEPVITPVERDVPGVGKVPTYNATIRMIGPDGKAVEKTVNSHDLSMQMLPYEKALELQRKGSDSDANFANKQATLELKGKQIELTNELGLARIQAAVAKAESGGSGGKIQKTFVDKDGYMVGVFRDGTSKRLQDESGSPIKSDNIEKRIDTLAKNLQTNSREYRRMPYADVRKAATGILSGGGDAAPEAQGSPTARQPVPASAKPDFSKLWKQ